MSTGSKSINMLNGSIWDKMIVFAIPLALTGVLQQLYNMADVAVLGHFVSNEAMAAVGNNVPVNGLIISFCMGLALGTNVVVARCLGMNDTIRASKAVHTSIFIALVFGLVAMIAGLVLCDQIMSWMDVPESVVHHASVYLRVYLLGMPFIALYNFLAAIYRSSGDTKTPLWALCAGTVFNVLGNLFFVLVLDWSIGGVALATALANVLASSILFFKLTRSDGPLHIELHRIFKPDGQSARMIVRIGWPAGLQSSVFSLSNLIIQSAINSLGPEVMAASVAAFTIEINVYGFVNAFGLAATTFISQNYGAGNVDRCKRITWISMGLNIGFTLVLSILILVFGHTLLGVFTQSEDIIALGMIRLWWVVVPEPLNAVMEVFSDAMRGYGYSLAPAIITVIVICSVRVIWVYTAFAMKPTYEVLMMVYPLSWLITSIGLGILYFWFEKNRLPKLKAE